MRISKIIITLAAIFSLQATAQVTGLSGWDIYLDPGHSRTENMGIYNYSEAEKNLRVSLHTLELLLTTTDIDTVWSSRYNDNVQVSLSQRTDEANSLGAAWYHSIHSNAGSATANNTLLLWGQYQNGLEKVPNGGKDMSRDMIPLLTAAMRIPTIGDYGDCSFYGCTFTGPYLHVNRTTFMPSELSEAGFHTSPTQNTRNMNAEWKRMEAYAFYWSILKYHNLNRPTTGIAAGYIYDIERGIPLNGATIVIDGQSYTTDTYQSLFFKYTSDPDLLHNGFYFFENVTPGPHQMIVSAEGFEPDTLTVTVSDTFITFTDVNLIDARPPLVLETIPAQNATEISVFDNISIQFSRRMSAGSVQNALTFEPPLTYTTQWQNSNRKLVLNPSDMLQGVQYTMTIDSTARDIFNHELDGNGDGIGGDAFTLTFTTEEEDLLPPQVNGAFPPQNAVDVILQPIINLEFDEIIDPASIQSTSVGLKNSVTGDPVPGTMLDFQVSDRTVFSFFPNDALEPLTQYSATVQPGLKDLFGNEIDTEQQFSFTTGNVGYQVITIDPFQADILTNWWDPQQSGTTTGILTNETSRGNNSIYFNLLSGSNRSMRLSYGWDVSAGNWLIREYLGGGTPRGILFDDTYILQVYIFGDGSGTKFRFAIDDNAPNGSATDHEVTEWMPIDWIGWRLVSWDLANDPIGTWLGNGVLNGDLRFDSFQISYDNATCSAVTGAIYFDDLLLVKPVVVGIDDGGVAQNIPTEHELLQNYPNPFNPTTEIRYAVANSNRPVKLTIYDMLGREVRTLVNTNQTPGNYTAMWDGRSQNGNPVASGTYLYTLSIGDFQQTRKMLLLK
ncbi:MAG: Ig-like domain-containing protein [Calditrichae bacterium]|nr:Ig-like domain-containing protein [Calditrichia bacterium]